MSSIEYPRTPEFKAQLDSYITERVSAAEHLDWLSHKGKDGALEVVQEADGRKFVRRSFSRTGISNVEDCGLDFPEAWETMQDIYRNAGISIVRTGLAVHQPQRTTEHPIVMVSELLEDSKPLAEASTQTKINLATKLPGLFADSGSYTLRADAIRPDMFRVVSNDKGLEEVVMVDVDPLLDRTSYFRKEVKIAFTIGQLVGECLWDTWCKPEERTTVLTEFIKAAAPRVEQYLDAVGSPVFNAFFDAHTMSQGIDIRGKGFSG